MTVLDQVLEATVIGSFSCIGYEVRRREAGSAWIAAGTWLIAALSVGP